MWLVTNVIFTFTDKDMDKELKLQYFERLIAKNGTGEYFIEQFLHGSGNELKKKFWSNTSSSRLCFDLYSWLCEEKGVKNFQFEKQLPAVKIGKVYCESLLRAPFSKESKNNCLIHIMNFLYVSWECQFRCRECAILLKHSIDRT